MSTKTLRKRIALVAVSAMGFGLLTSVAANAGTTAPTADNLYLNTTQGAGTGSVADAYTDGSNASGGYVTSSAASVSGGSSATATVLSTGGLVFATKGTNATCLVVSGGTISSSSGATSFNANSTAACAAGSTAIAGKVVPNAGVATFTVQAFQGTGVSYSAPTSGALIGTYVVTVASAASNGVPSAAYSVITQQASIAASGTCAGTNAYDTTTATPNGRVACVYVALADAYNSSITTGLPMSVTASNGAPVNIESTASASAIYSATGSFDSATNDGAMYIAVGQPVANKGGSTTLTISYNGAVVGTKTVTFTGDLAKIEAIEYASGTAGSTGTIRYRFYDDAGTRIADSAATGGIGTLTNTATGSGNTTTVTVTTNTTATSSGYATFNCASSTLSTATPVEVKATNQQGVTLKATLTAHCALATIATYTVALDKSSYKTGEVATLKITAKDLNGAVVASATTLGAGAAISVGGMTAVSAPTTADTSYNGDGVWEYTYTVGTTTGDYVASIKLPASAVDDTAKTIQFKIVASSTEVSNAEVLAAIVKLIASINKQIAALQKALTKKK